MSGRVAAANKHAKRHIVKTGIIVKNCADSEGQSRITSRRRAAEAAEDRAHWPVGGSGRGRRASPVTEQRRWSVRLQFVSAVGK